MIILVLVGILLLILFGTVAMLSLARMAALTPPAPGVRR